MIYHLHYPFHNALRTVFHMNSVPFQKAVCIGTFDPIRILTQTAARHCRHCIYLLKVSGAVYNTQSFTLHLIIQSVRTRVFGIKLSENNRTIRKLKAERTV